MSKPVRFNGQIVQVPDDATEAEIAAILDELSGGSTPKSGGVVQGVVNAGRAVDSGLRAVDQGIGDLATGFAKGAGDTAVSLGRLVHQIPGVSGLVDKIYGEQGLSERAFTPGGTIDKELETTNTMQSVGKGIERVGEFMVPSAQAARLAPLARGSLQPVRLGTRMLLEGAGAAPVAALHGESPTVAGVTAAAMPAAGKAIEPAGRFLIERAIRPTKAHLREMTGPARDAAKKIGRVVDTAIKHRIFSEGGAADEIGTRMDDIDTIFRGPAGRQPSNVHVRLPQAVDDFRTGYQGGATSQGNVNRGVMFADEGVASADRVMPEVIKGPLGKPNPPPVNLPAGMQASWPPRVLRDDSTAQEVYEIAKNQSMENAKIPFGEHLGPGPEAKKMGEMTLRNAAKDAADMPTPGVSPTGAVIPQNNLKPLFSEVSDLVDVRKATQNAPPDMPRTAAGEVLSLTDWKINMFVRMARAMGLPTGQLTHMLGEGLQGRQNTKFIDSLMRSFLTTGASSVTGEDR